LKTAFFDFDDTLTVGDTLPLWLAALHGWPLVIAAYAISGAIGWAVPGQGVSDRRGRIKAMLLRLLVRGLAADRAAAAGARVKAKVQWRTEMLETLRRHHKQGHRVVVVTGAATLYLPALLDGLPVDEVIGTELEIRDGRLTGRIAGVNRVRAAKAEAVKDWLDRHRPEETWGYGNAPHDLKILALLNHTQIVG
jgi:HAD superfamily hydrolase (TIGR01490 family)